MVRIYTYHSQVVLVSLVSKAEILNYESGRSVSAVPRNGKKFEKSMKMEKVQAGCVRAGTGRKCICFERLRFLF